MNHETNGSSGASETTEATKPKTGIHWYRHGLRLHDNPSMFACQDEVERFAPVFIFDGKTAGTEICGYARFRFLLESLADLEEQYASFGIKFFCFHGEPHEVLEKLVTDWNVKVISFEKDSEAIWIKRDNLVKDMCKRNNVQIIEHVSHTLYDPEDIFNLNDNIAPNTFFDLKNICKRIGEPEKPAPKPDLKFIASHLLPMAQFYDEKTHKVPSLDFFDKRPECKEQEVCLFKGGERKALELLKKRLENEAEHFRQGKINPNLSKPILFTEEVSLSPYLRFGCLSVRKLYWDLKRTFHKYFSGNKRDYEPTEQLLWREYFYQMSYKNEKFAQVDGNVMCFKIPWDYTGKLDLYAKWEQGQTGFPFIDACMRQLRQEGWIHHFCRNSVAIFLTRGDLFLSWERGMNTFFTYLIDADWSVCSGNWNWVSCGDPTQVINPSNNFCPAKTGRAVDPEGIYTTKYVPELKLLPKEYIFEPWKAPLDVQEAANCVVGRDYPEPCVDHEASFEENVGKLRQFFNSEKREIFELFLNDKHVVKSANTEEYKFYTFARVLEAEFDDF